MKIEYIEIKKFNPWILWAHQTPIQTLGSLYYCGNVEIYGGLFLNKPKDENMPF